MQWVKTENAEYWISGPYLIGTFSRAGCTGDRRSGYKLWRKENGEWTNAPDNDELLLGEYESLPKAMSAANKTNSGVTL